MAEFQTHNPVKTVEEEEVRTEEADPAKTTEEEEVRTEEADPAKTTEEEEVQTKEDEPKEEAIESLLDSNPNNAVLNSNIEDEESDEGIQNQNPQVDLTMVNPKLCDDQEPQVIRV